MTVSIVPIEGLPEFAPGDDVGALLADALTELRDGDVVAVTQKIVSKAEGRVVRESDGDRSGWVERETQRIVARRGDLVIAETRHGFVCANAGVDASNVAEGWLTLLPEDPDASAERIRATLGERFGLAVGVVVTDTFGRPWREGLVNVAIGCAGLPAVVDLRGSRDHHGRALEATIVALADEIAAASGLVMGKAARVPVAVVRGLEIASGVAATGASALVRRPEDDVFREAPLWMLRSATESQSLGGGEVPRAVLEEAVAAAATRAAIPLSFVAVTSAVARARLTAAIDGLGEQEDRLLAEAGAFVVPLVATAADEEQLVAAGGAVERLGLALHAQALGWAWTRGASGRREEVRAALAIDDGWTPLGIIAVGEMRTGAASPRPPLDLSALLRFE
jgi:coenzyme F420-0:L-glutamate ligase/coenzyme F420-1:gamma-L-glutamate ligase